MGQMYGMENIDDSTYSEGMELQRKLGVRWTPRDWGTYRTSRVTEREMAARKEKLQSELRPVEMTSKADTVWARSLSNLKDNQKTRTQKRIYDATQEAKAIEQNIRKWDKQTAEVLEGSRWGS